MPEAASELSDADASKLASLLPALLSSAGLLLDLELPNNELWQQAKVHDQAVAVHIVSLGATLLQLRATVPYGAWIRQLEKCSIERQRAHEAMRVVRWALGANVRAHGQAGKITHIGAAKLIELSRIPLKDLEKSGLTLDEVAKMSWRNMRLEISTLKKQLKQAKEADPNQSIALEKAAKQALRTIVQSYQDYADAVEAIAGLAEGWHGNARRGTAGRLESLSNHITDEIEALISARILPALAHIKPNSKRSSS